MKQKEQVGKYMEVWGDTIVPKELAISAIICVITTMVFFLAGRTVLLGIESLTPALAKGYALLVGILGTFLGAVICAKKFKPKRKIMIEFQEENIEDILKAAGMTIEEERHAERRCGTESDRFQHQGRVQARGACGQEDNRYRKSEACSFCGSYKSGNASCGN